MVDKEQEWIEKFRAAIEIAEPVKESRWKAILAGLSKVGNIVTSIMNSFGKRAQTVLSASTSGESPKLEPAEAPVTALEKRHRSPARSSKPISVERPASLVQQRRRAS